MAFELQLSVFNSGLESQALQALSALKYFATLTPPVTESVMRTDLETAQLSTFSNEGWDNFMKVIAATPLNSGSLTVAERAIVNTIIEVANPSPKFSCCGAVTPAFLDGKNSFSTFYRTGSTSPWQYEFALICDADYTCDIDKVSITITETGGAPPTTSTNPHVFSFNGCDENGKRVFSYIWVEFASDPSGGLYNTTLDFRDKDDVSIASFAGDVIGL